MKINTICFLQFFSLLPYFFYIFTKTLFFFWVTKWICHCEYSSWSVCTFNLFNGWMLADTKEVAILFMMVIGVMLPQFFLQGNCHYLHQSAGHVVRLWSERLVQIRLYVFLLEHVQPYLDQWHRPWTAGPKFFVIMWHLCSITSQPIVLQYQEVIKGSNYRHDDQHE